MTLSFRADEHVKRVFITELRANGYEVAWVDEDYESGISDREHLERSRQSGRIILSNDADFSRLHDEADHGGVISTTIKTFQSTNSSVGSSASNGSSPKKNWKGI